MNGFDTIVMVDWSGGNDRGSKPKKDAIWVGANRGGVAEEPVFLRNRQIAETWLAELFRTELAAGRRVLAGFDFPFSYPTGFCRTLTGSDDPLALWDWFEKRITDAPKANNRYDIAAQINRAHGGKGPFWGTTFLNRDYNGLARNKDDYANPFPDHRTCESKAKGAFTCWQLAYNGAVGSQTIMGMPVLARLRRKFRVSVWPFEALDAPIAFVEIWPSLTVGDAPEGMIKDAWQVAEVARQVAALSPEILAQILHVDAPQDEGWIFGLGFEDVLQARQTPPLKNDCFALPPGVHWTPVEEALALLKDRLHPVTGTQTLCLADALGRIIAQDITANRANPPLPNTAVDGYGFAGGRGPGVHELPLAPGRAAAGDVPQAVPAGHAMRVLTGAALPSGVDTVVLQEDVVIVDGKVRFSGPVKPGSNTRKAGEDVIAGQTILTMGQRINAPDLALMAATGVPEITVHRRLKVGVLSTGSELVNSGERAGENQIYDANRPMLLAMIKQFGHDATDLGQVPDDRETLRNRLDSAAQEVDVILTSGGASAGDEDHVSALLTEAGAMSLWRVAIKPGRPLALGMWGGVPVFGLPGNPVAALICTLIFARPAMALLSGGDWSEPQGFAVPAAFEKRKKAGRREYLRARIRDGKAEAFASEGSGRISGLSWAEGLVELSEPARDIALGDMVHFIPYASFGI